MDSQKFSLFKFADNLQTVFWPIKGVETVLLSLKVKTGGWYETEIKKGTFHFLEHMLAQGTEKYPTYFELAKKLENLGISTNNSVGGYFSNYTWSLPKETFVDSLNLLTEYVFNPLFSDKAIERERKIILQEYLDYWDKPLNCFNHKLTESFFGEGHPYTFDALGTNKSIESINKNDLLYAHQQYYSLNNIILGIVGNLEEKQVKEGIETAFQNKTAGKEKSIDDKAILGFTKKIIFHKTNADQITFSINFPTKGFKIKTIKEKYTLSLLSYLLGRSRVSHLNLRLREKEPLSYHIGSNFKLFPQKGVFTISFISSMENLAQILKIIKEEIDKIKNGDISDDEFESCKKYKIYDVSLSLDSIYSIADNIMTDLGYLGKIYLPEEKKQIIIKINQNDLIKIANETFDFNKATIGFMGNKKNLETIKKEGIDKTI